MGDEIRSLHELKAGRPLTVEQAGQLRRFLLNLVAFGYQGRALPAGLGKSVVLLAADLETKALAPHPTAQRGGLN